MWLDEASIDTSATPDRVWALWADPAGWHQWNAGVARIEMHGPFATGSQFTMHLPSQDTFTSTLKEVRPGEEFTDETLVGETRVIVRHRLGPLDGGGTRISYTTVVIGKDEEAIGLAVSEDFPQVLAALKARVEG
jgi:uncharacterized protein YndB with AHSA1/START domain